MTDEFGIAGKTLLVTGSGRNLGKAIILEFAARGANVVINSRSNAEEAGRWLTKHHFNSLRLITSDWHMRRARYEFRKVLKGKYELVSDAVRTEPSFLTLFGEYNKYVLRRIAVWADL